LRSIAEVLTFKELGYGIDNALVSSEIVDCKDVGVGELGYGLGLSLEAIQSSATLGDLF